MTQALWSRWPKVGICLMMAVLAAGSGLAAESHQKPVARQDFGQLSAAAEAARNAEKLPEAEALYRRALALKPAWVEGWWALGTIHYDADDFGQASLAFEKLLAADPKHGSAHLMLGLCLYELNQNEQAARHFAEARHYGIENPAQLEPVLLYHEAMLALRARHFETANQTLHMMARKGIRSEDGDLAFGMSVLLMLPSQLPPPGSTARRVVLRVGQAEATDSTETHELARRMFARVVEMAPEMPNIHFAYGRFLLGIQEPDAALNEFKEELKRTPGNIRAQLEIAAIDYRTDSEAGIPYAQAAVEKTPQYPFAHYLLGLLCLDAGQTERAIGELERARKMVPAEPQFAFALANAYQRAHRKQDAATERAEFLRLKQAQKESDDGPTYYDAGSHSGLHVGSNENTSDTIHE